MDTASFILKAKEIHGNKYDYSKSVYIKSIEKVEIVCPKHGSFFVTPNNHLSKKTGCPKCRSESLSLTKEEFVEKANKIHNNKFDYSKVNYVNYKTKVEIICPLHGSFFTTPQIHLQGKMCPKCSRHYCDTEIFIKRAKEVHGEKYDYSKSKYINNLTPIEIICPKHGSFFQSMASHVNAQCGCPECGKKFGKAEEEIYNYVSTLIDKSKIIRNDRKTIKNKKSGKFYELDILIPTLNVAIEYNGLYWHKDDLRSYEKQKLCQSLGIQLIVIFEDEWKNKQDIVKSRLSSILGKSKRIYARKCVINRINHTEAKQFVQNNHIQGWASSSINYGLYYEDELVATMTFSKPRFRKGVKYELLRYCSKINTNVIGGASKLLNHFIKDNCKQGDTIISYADKRWSIGNLYNKLEFNELNDSKPAYFYCKDQQRYQRVMFQKHKLPKLLKNFDKNLTESQNMLNNGYHKVYDCGNKVYLMTI